jgi:ribose transport system permease protein
MAIGPRGAEALPVGESPPAAKRVQSDPGRPGGGPRSAGFTWRRFLSRFAVLLVLVAMVVIYSILLPGTFFTSTTLRVVTSTEVVLMIAILGVVLPFSTGEFDLSFGPVIGWASCLLAVLTVNHHWSMWSAIPVVFVSCLLWGALNALFIVGIGVSSLITTLGSGAVISGLTLAITGSQVIPSSTDWLTRVTTDDLFGIPYPVYLAFLIALCVWFVQEQMPAGRYMYFTGEGRQVARLSGLPVDRIRTAALLASSTLCGLAGIVNFGRLGSADPQLGATFLLPGTAAVFLGATVIRPGRFNALGTVVALYVLVVGVTGLELLGGAGWYEEVFNGAVLVLAVAFAHTISTQDQA